jgi:hypothetical protein
MQHSTKGTSATAVVFLALFFVANAQAPGTRTAPPDYVNVLPQRVNTGKLANFFAQVRRNSDVPIRFTRINPSGANLWGQTSFSDTETVVKYTDSPDLELENLLTHELGHIDLQERGMSVDVRATRSDEFLNALRDDIGSATEDVLIAKMMLTKAFVRSSCGSISPRIFCIRSTYLHRSATAMDFRDLQVYGYSLQ